MNRHRADVAAGKKQRAHDIGIRRERDFLFSQFHHRRVVLGFQMWIAERFQKHFADELVHQFAAAAVRQQNVRVL